jgi:hypothetical protein
MRTRENRSSMQDPRLRGQEELSSREGIPYVMKAEEDILKSICAGVPLAQLLNRICSALDCEIGNVVSLVSMLDDNTMDFAAIAGNAKRFGLHTFSSLGVVGENGALLGVLEMYSCEAGIPTAREVKLIERAGCLAAIAIEREDEEARCANALESEIELTRESIAKLREVVN